MRNAVKPAPTWLAFMGNNTLSIGSLKVLSVPIFRRRNLKILEIPGLVIFTWFFNRKSIQIEFLIWIWLVQINHSCSLGPLLDNVFFQLHTTYLGTNLTAFRVAWKHLVNEDDALPYLDNQLPWFWWPMRPLSWTLVELMILVAGAKSMVLGTKIVTVSDILGLAQWNFETLGIKCINKIKN